MGSVISHRLDLSIVLIDTTNGFHVDEREVSFTKDDGALPLPVYRGDGTHLFIDSGRENFLMHVFVRGYEKVDVYVDYEKMDGLLPMKEIFLIPSENMSGGIEFATLSGKLPGLRNASLVVLSDVVARTDAYDERKKILKVFEKGYRINMEGSPYGLINEKEKCFQILEVVSQPDSDKVKLKEPMEGEFFRNAPICRMMFGYVEPDGSYLIRVRDDRSKLKCLIRYEVDSEIRFLEVDFHDPEDKDKKLT